MNETKVTNLTDKVLSDEFIGFMLLAKKIVLDGIIHLSKNQNEKGILEIAMDTITTLSLNTLVEIIENIREQRGDSKAIALTHYDFYVRELNIALTSDEARSIFMEKH